MKRILINATHSEEIRVATLQDADLVDYEVESVGLESTKGNIYKGKITAVQSDLEGAFVEMGKPRQGLLPLKKVMPQYYANGLNSSSDDVHEALKQGQELLVQIDKEARGDKKGPALTTEYSIAGRYVVLKPSRPTGGISSSVSEAQRDRIRALSSKLKVPQGMGWIIRTSAVNVGIEDLQADLDNLVALWERIETAGNSNDVPSPRLVHKENTLVERILRDRLREDIDRVIIDDEAIYNESKEFVDELMPHLSNRIQLHKSKLPLFHQHRIETKIRNLYSREVSLPSGGRLVIDPTEALVAIDVNSARATQADSLTKTALNTNLEAASEIARQLVLRNLGGLIVIDFIDMERQEDCEKVEKLMEELLAADRANTTILRISVLGLMELQRQRLRRAVYDTDFVECDVCGQGFVRSTSSYAMEVLRGIEARCYQAKDEAVIEALVPVQVGTFLLNEKREYISKLEIDTATSVMVVPIKDMEIKDTTIRAFRQGAKRRDVDIDAQVKKNVARDQKQAKADLINPTASSEQPVVSRADVPKTRKSQSKRPRNNARSKSQQQPAPAQEKGLLSKLTSWLVGGETSEKPNAQTTRKRPPKKQQTRAKDSHRGSSDASTSKNDRSRNRQRQRPSGQAKQTSGDRDDAQQNRSTQSKRSSGSDASRKTDSKRQQNSGNRSQQRRRGQRSQQNDSAIRNAPKPSTGSNDARDDAPSSQQPERKQRQTAKTEKEAPVAVANEEQTGRGKGSQPNRQEADAPKSDRRTNRRAPRKDRSRSSGQGSRRGQEGESSQSPNSRQQAGKDDRATVGEPEQGSIAALMLQDDDTYVPEAAPVAQVEENKPRTKVNVRQRRRNSSDADESSNVEGSEKADFVLHDPKQDQDDEVRASNDPRAASRNANDASDAESPSSVETTETERQSVEPETQAAEAVENVDRAPPLPVDEDPTPTPEPERAESLDLVAEPVPADSNETGDEEPGRASNDPRHAR